MATGKFAAALTIGSVPTAFAFAAIGAGWADKPVLALVVSYVLPILLLPIALYLMRGGRRGDRDLSPGTLRHDGGVEARARGSADPPARG
jgi:hypothetical protein